MKNEAYMTNDFKNTKCK